jgi:hypothetical protein
MINTLRQLYEFFPTAVYTGKSLVFISEDYRVELTEHKNSDFSRAANTPATIRVKIFKKALSGEYIPGHYEDFNLEQIGELAEQIEKYVQYAVGKNIREQV